MLYFRYYAVIGIFLGEIFTYVIVLYVFRAIIRRNNAEAIFAVRLKFFPLLFGMNKKLPENRNLKPALETNASKEIQVSNLIMSCFRLSRLLRKRRILLLKLKLYNFYTKIFHIIINNKIKCMSDE